MAVDEGLEGQLKVQTLLLLPNEDAVPRDAPRLKTLQRIYDRTAIQTLISGFKKKSEQKGLSWKNKLVELNQVFDG